MNAPLDEILDDLQRLPYEEIEPSWQDIIDGYGREGIRWLGRNDRFFLLVHLLHRKDADHAWLYARCREVEANTDGYLDLWAREHYKSTIITFAGSIQEILKDPEITIGLFSHTKPISRKFFTQIKDELEVNEELKELFPDVLYQNPKKDSPRWSDEKGIAVKRKSNPKEATLEAYGLVDGQPTSAHYALRIYDDTVTRESVYTPEQIKRTTDAWELSDNLGAKQESGAPGRAWHIGTRYSFADTYQVIIDRKALIPRVYPATDDGTPSGKPVFWTQETWEHKKLTQGPATTACQLLQNPAAGTEAMFNKAHLRFAEIRPRTLNIYIMCDPASSKKKTSDRTAISVIGVDSGRNKYLLDGYHHRMKLDERWNSIYQLRKHWTAQPGIQTVHVGYERYGSTSDMEYFEEKMRARNDSFPITELAWPRDDTHSKYDRIQRLYPDFAAGKIFLPLITQGETSAQKKMRDSGEAYRIIQPTKRKDEGGNLYVLNKTMLDEYLVYPFSVHDDFLDAMSRIYDMDYQPPIIINERDLEPEA